MSGLETTANAPVAQLDRVFGYEPKGRGFESLRARQNAGMARKNRVKKHGFFFSVSKNWLADSRLHKCGVRRRIGKPLDRVSHDATAHRAVASQLVKEGGVLLRRSAFFFCIWERKEEKGEKNRQKKSAAMSARRAF